MWRSFVGCMSFNFGQWNRSDELGKQVCPNPKCAKSDFYDDAYTNDTICIHCGCVLGCAFVVRCDEGCYRGGRVVPYKIIARGRGNDYKYCPYNVCFF